MVYNSIVGAPKPDLINIYNNTIYNSSANNGNLIKFQAIVYFGGLDASCHSEVKNNLAYSPNTFNLLPVMIGVNVGSSCAITGSAGTFGNSSDAQIKSGPNPFISSSLSLPADFRITSGSYGLNTGAIVKVFSDFFGALRPQGSGYDIGAVEGN